MWHIPPGPQAECHFERRHGVIGHLEMALLALGIRAKHSRPYHPQTCGKVERLNLDPPIGDPVSNRLS